MKDRAQPSVTFRAPPRLGPPLPTMIPADSRWAEEADPSEMHADAGQLVRYLAVATMAADHPEIPEVARRLFRRSGETLRDWEADITTALRRLDDLILRPALAEAA